MNKTTIITVLAILSVFLLSCKEESGFTNPDITGHWKQEKILINGHAQTLTADEENTSILFEANGVYRLFDGVEKKEHPGTWILTDKDWLTLSMDKIAGKNENGTTRYEQIPIRFTVLHTGNNTIEIRIKTTLGKRKNVIMFNEMVQDAIPATQEDALVLDTQNKMMYTYTYKFKKNNQ